MHLQPITEPCCLPDWMCCCCHILQSREREASRDTNNMVAPYLFRGYHNILLRFLTPQTSSTLAYHIVLGGIFQVEPLASLWSISNDKPMSILTLNWICILNHWRGSTEVVHLLIHVLESNPMEWKQDQSQGQCLILKALKFTYREISVENTSSCSEWYETLCSGEKSIVYSICFALEWSPPMRLVWGLAITLLINEIQRQHRQEKLNTDS